MSKPTGVTGTHIAAGVTRAALVGGAAGAVIGGTISAAKQAKDVKDEKITKKEAVANTAKDAAGSGIATAAGIAVAGAVGIGGLGGLLVMAAAATGAKYLWDASTAPEKKEA
jgi:hypothetical protein